MDLQERIDEQMRDAARAKDKHRLSTIRMIRAAIHNREIEKGAKLDEGEIVQTLSSMIKKARESIEQFEKGKRQDLVEKEKAEIDILLSFMPRQMDTEEIRAFVDQVIQELSAKGMKDFGRVRKAAIARLQGRADGKTVNEVVRERLSGRSANGK